MLQTLLKERKNIFFMVKGSVLEEPMFDDKELKENMRLANITIIADIIDYLNNNVCTKTRYTAALGSIPDDDANFIVVHDGNEGYQIDLSVHLWDDPSSLKASNEHIIIIEPIAPVVYSRWLETMSK